MLQEIDVYVILVNYNSPVDTIECLESLFDMDYNKFTVTVVDNSNNEISINELKAWAEKSDRLYNSMVFDCKENDFLQLNVYDTNAKLSLIKSSLNMGFASANNVGLKFIDQFRDDTSLVWILNNDTIVKKNCLQIINKHYLDRLYGGIENIGIIANKIYFYGTNKKINAIGGLYNSWFGLSKHIGEGEEDKGQFDDINFNNDVDYVMGASFFITSSLIKTIGFLGEEYFLYFEELDLAERAKKENFVTDFAPLCVVYHKEGAAINRNSGGRSLISDLSNVASRILYTKKFFPNKLFTIYLGLLPVLLNRILRGQINRVPKLLKVMYAPGKFKQEIITKQC